MQWRAFTSAILLGMAGAVSAATLSDELAMPLAASPASDAVPTLITGAHVFDGSGRMAKRREVLIDGDRIVAVGRRVHVPAGATRIDASGMTLMPGLHDLHIHTRRGSFASPAALDDGYAPYLAAGVTTINEFSVAGPWLADIRARATTATVPQLNLAIRWGVPGGHGTESAATAEMTAQAVDPAAVAAAMPGLLAYRPDLFKVFADGWRYGDPARPDRSSMDVATLRAITDGAHAAGIAVVTHTVTLAGARLAAAANVDAVVHGIGDALVDAATVRLMRAKHLAYVSTLVVYEPQQTRVLSPPELAMLRPADRSREQARAALPPEAIAAWDARRWATLRENIRRLHRGGIRIGIGTDAGIGGVYPGWATIREIRLLTELGFTPAQALNAATQVSAAIMGVAGDRGRIARGMRADLVLVGGRPDVRIEDLYDVRAVFVAGVAVPLEAERVRRGADLVAMPAEPTGE